MFIRRIIRGKSKLPAYHTAESLPFCRITRGKSKLSANYPPESFSIPRKVKISLLECSSLLIQIILDKKSTMGDQYYPDLKED
jgi:hypothetical protein